MSSVDLIKYKNSLLYVNKQNDMSFFERQNFSNFQTNLNLFENKKSFKNKVYKKKISLNGLGYKAILENNKLHLKLNFSHNLVLPIPSYIKKVIITKTSLTFEGSDLILLGNYIEYLYNFRQKDCYKGKGFSLPSKVVLRKQVKKK